MTEEVKPIVEAVAEVVAKPDTITIDIDGVSIPDVPVALAKQIIDKRQAAKKEVTGLREQVSRVEAEAKTSKERAQLLEAMKSQDVESVRQQVSQEYISKISTYENKIFKGEVKAILAQQGVLPAALEDACALAMTGVKVALDGDAIKMNDKDAKEYITEWVKTRAHLVAVQATSAASKKVGVSGATPKAQPLGSKQNIAAGLGKLFK